MNRTTLTTILSLAAVFVFVTVSFAGSIPASPATAAGAPSHGESDLANGVGDIHTMNVDWIVLHPDDPFTAAWIGTVIGTSGPVLAGEYIYLYQAENDSAPGTVTGTPPVPSGIRMGSLSVSVPTGTVTNAGVLLTSGGVFTGVPAGSDGDDLDVATAFHPSHDALMGGSVPGDVGVEPQGAGLEEEGICPIGDFAGDMDGAPTTGPGSGYCINPPDPILTTINIGSGFPSGDEIKWTFLPTKPPHHETPTLWFSSPFAPVYGHAAMKDGTTWETGATNAAGFVGEPVPVPTPPMGVPEPGTMALFAVGLLGVVAWKRKKN